MTSLDRNSILNALATTRMGRSLTVLEETGSTNDDARVALMNDAPGGHTVVADHQHHGRGSRGRQWQSPAGTDLYLSIVERPNVAATVLPVLTLAVGLAVADTLDHLARAPDRVRIKWPNDVWIDGKKASGILVEAVATGSTIDGVVIGIGLNVNRASWPPELQEFATSLHQTTGQFFDRNNVLAILLAKVESRVDAFVTFGPQRVVEEIRGRLALRGERVTCDGNEGVLLGIAASGALQVDTGRGVTEIIAGTLARATPCDSDASATEQETT